MAPGLDPAPRPPEEAPSRAARAGDVVLVSVLLAAAVVIHVSGVEAVPLNRAPGPLTVVLTAVAVATLVVRRLWPLGVLVVTVLAVLGLVLVRGPVGLATLGPFVAFHSAVSRGSRRGARAAVVVVLVALALTALLRPVDLSAEGALVSLLVFAGALVLATGTRARRDAAAAQVLAARRGAELERVGAAAVRQRALAGAARERARITRELHDVLGHSISVVVVQAAVAARFLETRPEQARTAVEEIAATGRRSLAEMRQLLGVLHDGEPTGPGTVVELPDLDDLADLLEGVGAAGLPVTLIVLGRRGAVPAGVALAAYRVVQEALTNCLRHASASAASVTVVHRPGAVEVEVVDDGAHAADGPPVATGGAATGGMTAGGALASPGRGIAGMRERVAVYGGVLTVGPRPGAGYRVHATFPLAAPVTGAAA